MAGVTSQLVDRGRGDETLTVTGMVPTDITPSSLVSR